MHDTVRTTLRNYVVIGVWFVVMLATMFLVMGPMSTLYEAFAAGPEMRALSTMGLAIVAATVVAAAVRHYLRALARPAAALARESATILSTASESPSAG